MQRRLVWFQPLRTVSGYPSSLNAATNLFSTCLLQIGVIEDTENRERLSKLLRFYSSKSEEQLTSLGQYVSRMKEGQKSLYYMAADSVQVRGGSWSALS